MCKEWGRYKVNVNCVAFGLINNRQTQPIETQQKTIDVAGRDIKVGVQPQMLDAMARMIPLGRGGTPEEAADADLLIAEAYYRDKHILYHLRLADLHAHLDQLTALRVILTHMSVGMLDAPQEPSFEKAREGLTITL